MLFEVGRFYQRSEEIHARFGGNRQSGISPSGSHPLIFIFKAPRGETYGYRDDWTDDGVFLYTGQGKKGDMTFENTNNRALRNHAADGRDLHLFEKYKSGGPYRYHGQFVCSGYHMDRGSDEIGNDRSVIVFHFVPVEDVTNDLIPLMELEGTVRPNESITELRLRAMKASEAAPKEGPSEGRRSIYERSRVVRDYVLTRASGTCESCGKSAPFERKDGSPYLEPHHIRRLSDGGPDHPRWVAAICPNCHREIHSGMDGENLNQVLAAKIGDKEERVPQDN
jgi:5-methylcytosine-specific restriction enzyme A